MKLNRKKNKLNINRALSFTGNLRGELRAWESDCQAKLNSGCILGYKELALYMYWYANMSEETNSGLEANLADGHDGVMNRAISFLGKASQNLIDDARFHSIGQLKSYANTAFKSAAADAGRRQSMPQKQDFYNQTLDRVEVKVRRVKRMIENPKIGLHIVDLVAASNCTFESLERQELKMKLKELLEVVLSQCKQQNYVQVLRMDMQGMNGPQIAAALGKSHANIRQMLHRAKTYVGQAILAKPDARYLIEEFMGIRIEDEFESSMRYVKSINFAAEDVLDSQVERDFLCMVA